MSSQLPAVGLLDVITDTQLDIKDLCPAGLFGRFGLYPASHDQFPNRKIIRCNRKARFIPPQCQDLSSIDTTQPSWNVTIDVNFDRVKSTCREIYGVNAAYAEGVLENFVAAYNLPLVVKFIAGSSPAHLFNVLRAGVRGGLLSPDQPFLFYAWAPEPGLKKVLGRRVEFERKSVGCTSHYRFFPGGSGLVTMVSTANASTPATDVDQAVIKPPCSQDDLPLSKVLSNRVAKLNPTAWKTLAKLCCNKVKLSPWKGFMNYHSPVPSLSSPPPPPPTPPPPISPP